MFEGVPVQELTLVTTLTLILLTKSEKFFTVLYSAPSRFFAAFIVISIISVLANGDSFSYAFSVIAYKYIKFYIGYLMLVVANDEPSKIRKTMFYIIVSGSIVSYFAINLMLTGKGVGAGIGVTEQTLNWRGAIQWLGSFGGTNTTGLLLLFIFSISLGFLYREKSKIKQIFYLSTTAWIGTAFFMTHSRGGFLGFMAALAFFFYIKTKIRLKIFLPGALILVVLVLVLKPDDPGRGLGSSSTPERVELYHQGLQMFKHNPIFGVGSSRFPNNNRIKKTAHNIYLNVLAETGFFGFFFFMAMWFVVIKKIRINLPTVDENSLISRNIQTSFLMITGIGVSLFFLSADHEIPYIAFALLTSSANQFNDTYTVSSQEYKTTLKVIIAIIAFVYVAIQLFFMLYR